MGQTAALELPHETSLELPHETSLELPPTSPSLKSGFWNPQKLSVPRSPGPGQGFVSDVGPHCTLVTVHVGVNQLYWLQ